MEIITEVIGTLLLEGAISAGLSAKITKPVRLFCIAIVLLFFVAVTALVVYACIIAHDDLFMRVLCGVLALLFAGYTVRFMVNAIRSFKVDRQ